MQSSIPFLHLINNPFSKIQMKKSFLIIAGLMFTLFAQSKEDYSSPKFIASQKKLEQIENHYRGKDYKMIVYGKNVKDRQYGEIVVVSDNDNTSYWFLRNDTVLSTGALPSDRIFRYKEYRMAGVRKEEDYSVGTYVPPIYAGIDMEYVVYREKATAFHFEYGKNNCFYKPNERFEKYRREWIEILRQDLFPLMKK